MVHTATSSVENIPGCDQCSAPLFYSDRHKTNHAIMCCLLHFCWDQIPRACLQPFWFALPLRPWSFSMEAWGRQRQSRSRRIGNLSPPKKQLNDIPITLRPLLGPASESSAWRVSCFVLMITSLYRWNVQYTSVYNTGQWTHPHQDVGKTSLNTL